MLTDGSIYWNYPFFPFNEISCEIRFFRFSTLSFLHVFLMLTLRITDEKQQCIGTENDSTLRLNDDWTSISLVSARL